MNSFIEKRIGPVLESPIYLLMLAAQVIFILSVGRALTDILPTVSSMAPEVLLRVSFSNLAGAAFIYALMAAFLALVFRINGWPRPTRKNNESLTDKVSRYMQDPEAGFKIAMYATIFFGALATLLIIWEVRDFSNERLFREAFARIWQHLIGAVLVLFGARAIVGAVNPNYPTADDSEESTEQSSESSEDSSESGSFMGRYDSYFENPRAVLKVGGFVLVYLAFAVMIAQLWLLRDGRSTSNIIGTISIWMLLAVASGLVPMLFVWALDRINGRPGTEASSSDNLISRVVSQVRNPETALPLFTWAMVASGGLWFVVTMWSSRNAEVSEFWGFVLTNLVLLISIAAIPLMSWSLWLAYGKKGATGSDSTNILADPNRLAIVLIFLLAYVGLAMTAFNAWLVRIWGPADAWSVVIQDLTNFGIPIAILIGIRAAASAYEARYLSKQSAGSTADTATSESGTSSSSSSTGGMQGRMTISGFSHPVSLALWGVIVMFLIALAFALHASAAGTYPGPQGPDSGFDFDFFPQ